MLRITIALARELVHKLPGKDLSQQLVFPGELAGEVTDPWMKRLIALADGRSAGEIAQTLYLEELRSGAGMADIGLWKGIFISQVDRTLEEMAARGYIRLVSREAQDTAK